jgi:hypothetical protein
MGRHVDRCVLYTFRCAVYFASESKHDPELLKWWNWKDGTKVAAQNACLERKTNPNPRNLTRIRSRRIRSRAQSLTILGRM